MSTLANSRGAASTEETSLLRPRPPGQHQSLQMHDARTLRQAASCAVLVLAIAFGSSCGRRQGETSSAARTADRERTTSSTGSAARLANEPPANTFEHPALQERLMHERWHGDLH